MDITNKSQKFCVYLLSLFFFTYIKTRTTQLTNKITKKKQHRTDVSQQKIDFQKILIIARYSNQK